MAAGARKRDQGAMVREGAGHEPRGLLVELRRRRRRNQAGQYVLKYLLRPLRDARCSGTKTGSDERWFSTSDCNPARNTGSSFVGKRRRRQFTGPAVNVSGRGSRDKKSHGTSSCFTSKSTENSERDGDTERRAAARAQLRIGSARRKWLEYEQSGASVAERVFRPRTCRSLRAQPEKREKESSVGRAELPGILEQSRKAQSDAADTGFDVCVTASVAPKRVCATVAVSGATRRRAGVLRLVTTASLQKCIVWDRERNASKVNEEDGHGHVLVRRA
ncbi:uncharacterized protein PITG_01826 [Phytophthora infestans T30-4]|uniref:Uncharacterized protein n=1 Tax=Phytophthora infestans (strain T30-4) TaxID=403677 RepID=D0MU67_PHYIT|nr:uncharacterized protein PITG_01826 [Phytophthora infestans T30-4]EEY61514.1 conserved hypothetical protein [Phytophthora infestans T30-4]|eukprot:XP_002908431.1 conserved hypothetical protein [Phytophthora infestans T30-4]